MFFNSFKFLITVWLAWIDNSSKQVNRVIVFDGVGESEEWLLLKFRVENKVLGTKQ